MHGSSNELSAGFGNQQANIIGSIGGHSGVSLQGQCNHGADSHAASAADLGIKVNPPKPFDRAMDGVKVNTWLY